MQSLLGDVINRYVDNIDSILDGVLRTHANLNACMMHWSVFERKLMHFPFKDAWSGSS